ncbi:MAG: hypothetical protein DYG88_17730 [Chloroflexi bacterium CFX4]|nr:hypothetical protein [Chloroflexi bacterium CFX4]MDL1924378.1 hypothetical protein [Chloroflexi bacterium CFX3]
MRLLGISLLCSALLAVSIFTARRFGAQTPDSAALAFIRGLFQPACALPDCWHDIRFSSTTLREAVALLEADPALRVEVLRSRSYGTWVVRSYRQTPPYGLEIGFSGYPDAPLTVTALWMHFPSDVLYVGEVIAAFGAPEWAWLCAPNMPINALYRLGVLRFAAPTSHDGRLTPYAPLRELEISLYMRRDEPVWQGFTYRARQTAFAQRLCR